MPQKEKRTNLLLLVIIVITAIATVVIWAVFRRQSSDNTELRDEFLAKRQSVEHHHSSGQTPGSNPQLADIARKAVTWSPAFTHWQGKPAPDFTIADVNGKLYKLSDYKGKKVMLVFWATWCRPCLQEIPHLIALRDRISEDELTILAISNEALYIVKDFAAKAGINYPVFAVTPYSLPAPYNRVNSIPCGFFIDTDGRIKLATVGTLSLGEIKAILRAK